ncbi:MAG: SpoIIIAH-like family protein [Lachnospiraceae bacterium]|nr:SpoIIIAH-like family protein [Lachnospiraceae bacterium]
MKRVFRKNQIVVAALALMIAAAGYLNYTYENDEKEIATMATKNEKQDAKKTKKTASLTEEEILTDTEASSSDMGDDHAGETVLTDSKNVQVSKAASLKMDREQTRAAAKSTLMEVVNNSALTDVEKQAAVEELAVMTELAQKEAACELMLSSKGFEEAVVSIAADGADVILNATEVTDAQRAQVEDIINRKAGIAADHIVISTMN